MSDVQSIGQKLWNLCTTLWDDGITYHQYVTELTYLLFLKMAEETSTDTHLPEKYRWNNLKKKDGQEQLNFYKELLLNLGQSSDSRIQAIFVDAKTFIRQPRNLKKLIVSIDEFHWHSEDREQVGDAYEDLLQRNATEVKSGAGQYFTPRPLIECMIELIKPQAGEVIQDPALGTAGFLIAANRYIKRQTNDYFDLKKREQQFQREDAFYGMELVKDTHRLALMNCWLHDLHGHIESGDTLSTRGEDLPDADVIVSNPPFGTKSSGDKTRRSDFTYQTSNKQLSFLQHIYRGLKPGGRAAVVLPDNVLFEEGVGVEIRRDLLDKCDLHTILRLPTGIFYAQGVKTNVLFFTRGTTDKGNTKKTWVYDLRADMPSFGKRIPLTRDHFKEFEKAFGADPYGKSRRKDQGEGGRFRCYTREEIHARGDNLNISWLKGGNGDTEDSLQDPADIAAAIMAHLQAATEEMGKITDLLNATNGSKP